MLKYEPAVMAGLPFKTKAFIRIANGLAAILGLTHNYRWKLDGRKLYLEFLKRGSHA